MSLLKNRLAFLFEGEAVPHTIVLGFCLGMVFLAVLMSPPKPGTDKVTMGGIELPMLCSMRRNTGIPCPGCGLTRSFVAAASGDIQGSRDWHAMGPVIFLYVLLQILRHVSWFALKERRITVEKIGRFLDWALLPIGLIMGFNWLRTFF